MLTHSIPPPGLFLIDRFELSNEMSSTEEFRVKHNSFARFNWGGGEMG